MVLTMIVILLVSAFVFGMLFFRILDRLGILATPKTTPLDSSFERAQSQDDAMLQQGWFVRDAGQEGRQLGYWGDC